LRGAILEWRPPGRATHYSLGSSTGASINSARRLVDDRDRYGRFTIIGIDTGSLCGRYAAPVTINTALAAAASMPLFLRGRDER